MTTRPRLYGGSKTAGLAAVALFALLAYVVLAAEFSGAGGFPEGASVVASLGYLLFDLRSLAPIEGEGFLAAFLIVALVLDAALGGAVMLATREGGED